MNKAIFDIEMNKARFMKVVYNTETWSDNLKIHYWTGYIRGIRRVFHGEKFGTKKEHLLWLKAIKSIDAQRKERGKGYRDGLKVKDKKTAELINDKKTLSKFFANL